MSLVTEAPRTPATEFAKLMDALTRMTAIEAEMRAADDLDDVRDVIDQFDKEADRAIAAHSWLVLHDGALQDITDVLQFIYGEVAP